MAAKSAGQYKNEWPVSKNKKGAMRARSAGQLRDGDGSLCAFNEQHVREIGGRERSLRLMPDGDEAQCW